MAMQSAPASGVTSDFANDYWSELTDEQLESVTWFTSDPQSLENIHSVAPPEIGKFIIEVEYKLNRDTDQPVRCAHCPNHTPHWHGFVLRTDDGKRYLLGSVCGPKAYGADYNLASSLRNEKLRRYEAIARWRRVQGNLPANIEALATIERSVAFRCISTARGKLESMAPKALALIRSLRADTLNNQITLTAVRSFRDFEAEKARVTAFLERSAEFAHLPNRQQAERSRDLRAELRPYEPIERVEEHVLGPLQGAQWLLQHSNPAERLREITMRMRAAYALGQTTQDKATIKISQIARMVENELREAADALAAISDAGKFFEQENLARLAAWASAHADYGGEMRAEGSRLHVCESSGNSITLELPPGWAAPEDELLT